MDDTPAKRVRKKGSTSPKFFVLFLIVAAVFVAIGYFINVRTETTPTDETTGKPEEAIEGTSTPTPSPTSIPEHVEGLSTRRIQIFLDSNEDGTKGSGEQICDICVSKTINVAQLSSQAYPPLSQVSEVTIKANGSLPESKMISVNTTWGFFEDREVIIKPQAVAVNDGSGDIFIPAVKTSVSVPGVNASIVGVDIKPKADNIFRLIYKFSRLIPTFLEAAGNGDEIWVKYTPDSDQPGKHLLASGLLTKDQDGTVTGSPEGYYLLVDWQFEQLPENADNSDNLRFILL
ncbi:MAG: hypothetical protein ACE5DX_02870 [Candidatus Dojkabacteria bacterium]